MALRRANRPVIHDGGVAKGTITELGEQSFMKRVKEGRDIIDQEITSFTLVAEVEGVTGTPIRLTAFAGLNISDEKVKVTGRGNKKVPQYNRMTTLALKVGAITEKELEKFGDEKTVKKIDAAFAKLIGKPIAFKIARKDNGFYEIDVNTITMEG